MTSAPAPAPNPNARPDLEAKIFACLETAMKTGDPSSPEAKQLVEAHAQWLKTQWPAGTYSAPAHLGLASMYLHNALFVEHYDSKTGTGATEFLVEALKANLQ